MSVLLTNLLLALAWGAITGSFGFLNLLFGFVLASLSLLLIREQIGTSGAVERVWRAFTLACLFLYELVVSSVRVALIVLSPGRVLRPAIIAYPLQVDRDFEITLLASLITLTPGTLSLDVSEDRQTLFIHCIDVPDVDAVIADIRNGFERKIMETFR